jgi:arabinofuranosyltransferase
VIPSPFQVSRNALVVFGLLVVLALAAAIAVRFGCDDAFISFQYSRSLVRGDGLTWFGEHIEGYTNFLWVLWCALGIAAGVAPLVWAWIGSIASMIVVLGFTLRLARVRTDHVIALTVVGLLATNFTFVAFATSGLETMLQTAFVVAFAWRIETIVRGAELRTRALVTASVLAALAILTRLDSAVLCGVLAVPLLHRLVKTRAPVRTWLAAAAPVAIVIGTWLVWKLAYYGDIVPNTAHVKLGFTMATAATGAQYVGGFLHAYLIWPVLLLAVGVAAWKRTLPRMPLGVTLAWFAYVSAVGGDFMEFRFCVPAMPFVFLAIAEALVVEPSRHLRALVLVVFLAAFSWRHASRFDGSSSGHRYDSVPALASFYGLANGNWQRLGTPLHALAGTGATIATHGAGCIPYYADLPTIDMLGLNDAWIARHGETMPGMKRPGHQRQATLQYLVERKATFVLGNPTLLHGTPPPKDVMTWIRRSFATPQTLPSTLTIVSVPIDAETDMLAWYLTPSPAVDARLRELGWPVRVLSR